HTRYWRDWSSDVCSSDLAEIDLMLLAGGKQSFPEVDVGGWLAAGQLPAAGAPSLRPAEGHGLHQVLGVAVQYDDAGLTQRLEGHDGRQQLHSVVGGEAKSAG